MDQAGVRPRPGRADLAILAYAAALLVVWSPLFNLGLLSPRIAVLFVGLGPGLVVLIGLTKRGDVGARWAAAYLTWAALAVALSHQRRLSLMGSYGADIGWIYLMGYFSAWALGRRLRTPGRRLLPAVLFIGLGVNALFAVLEAAIKPAGDLATEAGRVHGLMSNSLFLAGVLVGGVAMAGHRAGRDPGRRLLYALGVIPLVVAVNLTGSRAALVGSALLGVAAAFVAARTAPQDAERDSSPTVAAAARLGPVQCAALVGAAVVLGFLFSLPLQGAQSSSSRLSDTSASGGYTSRGIMWGLGLRAAAERPLAGWGPGRFREATAPRVTREFAIAEGPDKLFYDAHNIIIENLVGTGVVGLGLLAGFAVATGRRCRGPLAWFAGGVALTWMFNPVSVCTGAIAMLALGAAWQPRTGERRLAPAGSALLARTAGSVLVVIGLLAGSSLLWADHLLDDAIPQGDVAGVRRAQRFLPGDPSVEGYAESGLYEEALEARTTENRRAVVESARRSVEMDPTRDYWWTQLALADANFGEGTKAERYRRAEADARKALELSPWSVGAMLVLRGLAVDQHDRAAKEHWTRRLCEIDVCLQDKPGR